MLKKRRRSRPSTSLAQSTILSFPTIIFTLREGFQPCITIESIEINHQPLSGYEIPWRTFRGEREDQDEPRWSIHWPFSTHLNFIRRLPLTGEPVDKFHSVKWRRGWRVGFRSRSSVLFSQGIAWRRGEIHRNFLSSRHHRFLPPSFPWCRLPTFRQPVFTPRFAPSYRGKLLRGASLF